MAAAEPAAGKLAAFIASKQLKVMSAAITAIARIGKSVFLDASSEGVRFAFAVDHRPIGRISVRFTAKHANGRVWDVPADHASRSE
jgi:hypothetical protein